MIYFLRKYKSIFHTVSAMSPPSRHGAIHKRKHESMAANLLEIDDASYREFLKQTPEINQLFDYYFPGSRLQRAREEQVKFVAEKLLTNPALASQVRNFICHAGLQETKEAFRNEQYHM